MARPTAAPRWRSGRISSSQQVDVRLPGAVPLRPATRYHWQVRVWDGHHRPSPWSSPARFETGLLAPTGWSGAGRIRGRGVGPVPAMPLLRHELQLRAACSSRCARRSMRRHQRAVTSAPSPTRCGMKFGVRRTGAGRGFACRAGACRARGSPVRRRDCGSLRTAKREFLPRFTRPVFESMYPASSRAASCLGPSPGTPPLVAIASPTQFMSHGPSGPTGRATGSSGGGCSTVRAFGLWREGPEPRP